MVRAMTCGSVTISQAFGRVTGRGVGESVPRLRLRPRAHVIGDVVVQDGESRGCTARALSLPYAAGSSPGHSREEPNGSAISNQHSSLRSPGAASVHGGEEIQALLPTCVESELVWHECQDCGQLWALPQAFGSHDIAVS
jgi:hypothetical protein